MEYKKLGDIATYVNGYAFKPEQRGKKGLPIIRIQDLTGNSYDLGYYEGDYPKKIELNNGDVLISWSASLGVYHWNRGKALLNQHIFKVIFDKVNINKFFFMYAVEYNLKKMSLKTHGATMKHITKKDFDNVIIPFPTLEKQGEIAQDLNIIKRIIEKYNQQINLLDELVKARFVELFGNIFDNKNCFPIVKIEDVCSLIKDGTHQTPKYVEKHEGGFKFLSSKDVMSQKIDWSNIKYIPIELHEKLYSALKPQKNDILMSKNGVNYGVAAINDTNEVFDIYVSLALLRPKDIINSIYFRCAINSYETKRQFDSSIKCIGVPNLHLGEIKKTKILLPPIELQNQFADFIKEVDKSRLEVQKSLEKTQELFDSLMQKYFG
ncbi:restriction endonuclease subunit S [Erysipelatoclostridium ramosum]|uniref:restriction endonuclease subunit S n=1 Tax=Thomasclavelia ramosa TaxID=1547 RepID=UPI001D06C016|nr:restriction endonuclease subunit S [Thomasclavelia ramosa]MCB6555413.1 restriction endonuclease subunit S [Thomasclavelia ramosa]